MFLRPKLVEESIMLKIKKQATLTSIDYEGKEGMLQILYKFLCITNNIQLAFCIVAVFVFLNWLMMGNQDVYILGNIYSFARLAELIRILLLGSGGWYVIRKILEKYIEYLSKVVNANGKE